MSQSVERLKELLFDSEAQELADLARRIDAVAEIDGRGREELKQKLAQIFDRVGTSERFTTNVANVLDTALRQAEVSQHAQLSAAMAPMVITTIKAAIPRSACTHPSLSLVIAPSMSRYRPAGLRRRSASSP